MLARFARSGSQSNPPLKNPRSANELEKKLFLRSAVLPRRSRRCYRIYNDDAAERHSAQHLPASRRLRHLRFLQRLLLHARVPGRRRASAERVRRDAGAAERRSAADSADPGGRGVHRSEFLGEARRIRGTDADLVQLASGEHQTTCRRRSGK